MERSNVIIIGGNHHNTLGVLRSLGYNGIKSTLLLVEPINSEDDYVLCSKYIENYFIFSNYQEAVNHLIDNKHNFREGVIICTSDGASSVVDLNFNLLNDNYKIPNARLSGVITHYMNKEIMAETAASVGLKVPKTWLYLQGKPIPKYIEYPCIMKPLLSIEGSKTDIVVCKSKLELIKYFESRNHCHKIQIQKFIDKDFEYQIIGCSFNAGYNVIIPGVSKVIRPSDCSNTGFLKYDYLDNSYPIDLCVNFLKKVGYSGLFSMEFLRDKLGTDYFLEINFRNDGNAICVTASGVNLPYLWYLHNSNIDISSECQQMKTPVYVMPEFDDFVMVLKRQLSLLTWIKDVKRTDCFMEYDKTDSRPFYMRLKNFIFYLFKKVLGLK